MNTTIPFAAARNHQLAAELAAINTKHCAKPAPVLSHIERQVQALRADMVRRTMESIAARSARMAHAAAHIICEGADNLQAKAAQLRAVAQAEFDRAVQLAVRLGKTLSDAAKEVRQFIIRLRTSGAF